MSVAPFFKTLVIGGSAGAIEPLKKILSDLPVEKNFCVIVVLHILGRQKSLLPELFSSFCAWPVKEAESTESIEPGVVYFAPSDYHLSVEPDFTFSISNEEPVKFSRPSIDILFTTAASAYKSQLAGLLLSGANDDGMIGFNEIIRRGGQAYAQDPSTAEFKEMPQAALSLSGGVVSVTPAQVTEILHRRP